MCLKTVLELRELEEQGIEKSALFVTQSTIPSKQQKL